MNGTYEIVIDSTRKIESLLRDKLGAEGRGLHTKTESVEDILDKKVAKKIHYIATIRNNLMHEDGFDVPDIAAFEKECLKVIDYLSSTKFNKSRPYKGRPLSGGVIVRTLKVFGMPMTFFVVGFLVFFTIFTGNSTQQPDAPFSHIVLFCLAEGYLSASVYWGFTSFNRISMALKVIIFPFTLIAGICVSPVRIYQGVQKIRS